LHESRLAACKEFTSKGRHLFFNLPHLARTSIFDDAQQLQFYSGSVASPNTFKIVAQSTMTLRSQP